MTNWSEYGLSSEQAHRMLEVLPEPLVILAVDMASALNLTVEEAADRVRAINGDFRRWAA